MTDPKNPQAWTEEPWSLDSGSAANPAGHVWKGKRLVAGCNGFSSNIEDTGPINEANAARIVSCVNALAGVADPVEWRKKVHALVANALFVYESKGIETTNELGRIEMETLGEAITALLALESPPND